MKIEIREIIESDVEYFPKAFKEQGWDKPLSQFRQYFEECKNGKRKVFVATADDIVAGYATLLPCDDSGPFKEKHIPVICDFNVLRKFQKHGIGSAILDFIESSVKKYSSTICLGVGLHYGYGSAQRMYVKRGYIPDGSGVWYNGEKLEVNALCKNDDELILYLSKEF